MKVVLAFPARRSHLADHSSRLLPLGLLSMASTLQHQGHEVRVLHLGPYRRKDALHLLLDPSPDVVALSCFTFQRHETLDLARAVRQARPSAFTLLGGPHAAPLAGEILAREPAVDAVATGEGENTIADLATRLEGGGEPHGVAGLATRRDGAADPGPPARPIEDLDDLPSPTRAALPILGVSIPLQLRHLTASRGCSAGCTFCRAPVASGRHVRRRSVESMLAEVAWLRSHHGLVFLSLRDDTFTADRAWVQAFCRGLVAMSSDVLWDCQTRVTALDGETADLMRRAGCVQVQIGLESASERILRRLRKPFTLPQAEAAVAACRAAGLLVSLYLLYGVPGERGEDLAATEAFVRRIRPSSLSVARLCHYPGTPLSAEVPAEAWFREPDDNIYAWHGPAVPKHGERLRALDRAVRADEPFTLEELRAVARRLPGPAPAAAVAQGLEGAERLAEAEQAWRDLVAAWPGYCWGEVGLGDLLLEQGRPGEAEPPLRRAMESAPRWPYALDRLGWSLRLQGREREGDALLAQALALDPQTPPPEPPGR